MSVTLAGICLLTLPRSEWPALHDLAWQASTWLGSVGTETHRLPARAREELLQTERLQGVAGQQALRDWQRKADISLRQTLAVDLPYEETLVLSGDERALPGASAQTFRIRVPAAERLRILTEPADGAHGGMIVDVFEAGSNGQDPSLIASFGPAPLQQRVVLPVDAARAVYLRVQSTPAAIGRFALRLDAQPAFDFPVDTDASSPVRSRFGVARDGGRRTHHGIDIFASRGTDVLAAADGVVVRTGDSPRGGLHVWQRAVDERGDRMGSLYYAHLDRIHVQPGQVVGRGDRLGTVGNTGNARTTPPHLHFGLYRRFSGPVDPLPLTGVARRAAPDTTMQAALPRWLSVVPRQANLRRSPDTSQAPAATLTAGELVRVDGILPGGRWLRIRSAAAGSGWIARSLLAPPREGAAIAMDGELRSAPAPDAPLLTRLDDGTEVTLLGRFGTASRVRTADGLLGWLTSAAPATCGGDPQPARSACAVGATGLANTVE